MSPWSGSLDTTLTAVPSLEISETPRDHRITPHVDAQGNDLWDGGDIGDNHFPCPPFCSAYGPFMP
jgi:hypothetical protein